MSETTNSTRRDWTQDDIITLMGLWNVFHSVSIIAAIMDRNPASVQTQASRRQLPRRKVDGRKRRRWSMEDDIKICEFLRQPGRLDIIAFSKELDRSIDACVARFESHHNLTSRDLIKRIKMPEKVSVTAKDVEGRRCPNCSRMFIPKYRFNYVCTPCKNTAPYKE